MKKKPESKQQLEADTTTPSQKKLPVLHILSYVAVAVISGVIAAMLVIVMYGSMAPKGNLPENNEFQSDAQQKDDNAHKDTPDEPGDNKQGEDDNASTSSDQPKTDNQSSPQSNSSNNTSNQKSDNNSTGASNSPKTQTNSQQNTSTKPSSSSNSGSSSVDPSTIIGYWRLDGMKYATLQLNNEGRWVPDFMDINASHSAFITTEGDGWVPQSSATDSWGKVHFFGQNLSSEFSKSSVKESVQYLVQKYGLSYSNGKIYMNFGGHKYSFTKASSTSGPIIHTKIRELDIISPNTPYATSELCLRDGDSVILHIVKSSLPFTLKNYSTPAGFDIVIEQLANDANGDYTLRVSKPAGGYSGGALISLPGLTLRIDSDYCK